MRILLVTLGAAEFPRRPDLNSPAFAASHAAVKGWLTDPAHGPVVQPTDVLPLFDSKQSWPDQEAELADWLAERVATEPAPTDLLIHYVGHGGFRDESRDYYLAIRATRRENPFYSSIMVDSLWRTLRGGARRLRRFLLIDACFAAAAARAMMSPLEEVVKVKLRELGEAERAEAVAQPDRGTAVLCSSSAVDPSSLAGAEGVTQFTDGLLGALGNGSATAGERLSLAELRELVRGVLRDRYGAEAVLPELHAPDQRVGLPQEVPLFPNLARLRVTARVKAAPRGRDESDIPLQMATGNPTGADISRDNRLIQRPQYALSWNAIWGNPNWVSWHLRESDLGTVPRADLFRADTSAPTVARRKSKVLDWRSAGARIATLAGGNRMEGINFHHVMIAARDQPSPDDAPPVTAGDYRNSGYDRGHLCPPGDRKGSQADQTAVFLMSNVVPQSPIRNQKLWQGLEEHCRALAREGWELFVIAGPGGYAGTIAEGRVVIPAFLWKVALALPPGATLAEALAKARVYAIRMANGEQARITDWRDARVTVGSLEDELGYTFFDALGPAAATLKQRIEVA